MDLKDLIPATDVVEITLEHPTKQEVLKNDDGSDMTITVYAPHSKEYKNVVYEQTNKRLKVIQGKGRRNQQDFTAQDLDEATLNLLAETTKSWNITFDGKKTKFSIQAAKDIYSEVFWIKDQIQEALQDSEVFT